MTPQAFDEAPVERLPADALARMVLGSARGLSAGTVRRLLDEAHARERAEREHARVVGRLATHVTPATARMLQATANRIQAIDDEFGLLGSAEVAGILGSRGEPRSFTADLRRQRRILSLPRLNRLVYPGFQFDRSTGAIRPLIAPLIELAVEYDRAPENIVFWLCRETSYLDGDRPVDHLDDADRILEVASEAWGVDW